ncbi:arylsulfatase A-like enzyme [Dyadobacter jejuensis]|uniref:Arylsulfatase A-like enzyme n=2 Tax=Dyadobacter jejuensis TaxID=1082580 RepID=A0A316ACS2_9BACT|nr:arylsulfatase A-like enzyme [Dyadobacter jejuensis]
MNKNSYRFQYLLGLLMLVGIGLVQAQNAKPNILVVLCDDLGYADVGFNGSKDIVTPHLDKLAKGGAHFTSAYVAHPFCGPSRAALFTGRYPHVIGTPFNLRDDGVKTDDGVPTNEVYISNVLHDAGYYTGIVGKWHLGYADQFHPNNRGFDDFYGFLGGGHNYFPEQFSPLYEKQAKAGVYPIREYIKPLQHNGKWVQEKEYVTDGLSREAMGMIKGAASNKKPFFLYLAYNAPHVPLEAKEEDLKHFAHIKDKDRRTYAAMVYAVDRGVGEIVKVLKETNQYDNTLIVFLSDNGGNFDHGANNEPLKGTKGDTFEGGYRVPMFMHWPGKITAGSQFDFPVTSLDLYPTFAHLAGAQIPKGKKLDGKNIIEKVIKGENPRPNEMIYALRYRFGYTDVGARMDDWKATRVANEPWQLFNIKNDIGEKHDLSKRFPDRLAKMVQQTQEWSKTHVQPLWWYYDKEAVMWKQGLTPNYKETFSIDE